MRVVIQRVSEARVTLQREGDISGAIGVGLVVLCGFQRGDTPDAVGWMARKIAELRVFEDAHGRMNVCVRDIPGGQVLLVPNFTVACGIGTGRRPSFDGAMAPGEAEAMFALFVEKIAGNGVPTQAGVFGAEMRVEMCNDGPVTFVLESPSALSSVPGR